MKAALAKILKDVAVKKIKNKVGNASSFFSNGEMGLGILVLLAPLIPIIVTVVIVIGIVMLPIMLVNQYLQDVNASETIVFKNLDKFLVLSDWCQEGDKNCEKEATQKYYEELEEVYNKYKDKGVEIDVQLITATIFYANTQRNDLFTGEDDSKDIEEGDIKLSDIDRLASNMVNGKRIDYEKYKNYLIDTYIPNRFSALYDDRNDKDAAIEEIADQIMGFQNENITIASINNYNSVGIDCTTISLKDKSGNVTVHELEEYVAGVVSAENQYGIETSKMQAIAARTVAVARCNEVIENSTNVQVYTTPTEAGKQAAEDTKGLILVNDGKPLTKDEIAFASYPQAYWSDKHLNDGFPAWYQKGAKCGAVTCESKDDGRTWCSTIIYKLPNLEPYTLDMPDTTLTGDYWNNLSLNNQSGHCYGVSQVASRYYESELNYSYEQMINVFFSPSVAVNMIQDFATGRIGSTYTSNVPMYETAAAFYSNVNYNYYLSTSAMPDPKNYGECPWYAQGRAIEIVANSNIPEARKQQMLTLLRNTRVDGGLWYGTLKNSLSGSTDIYAAKPGSIITWASAGNYGHVGIIEDVEYDSDGRAKRVLVTESWNGTENPANASYSYSWQTIDAIRYYTSLGHGFVGYTYLLD